MRTIFDMQLEIERRYKDGDDWVYDKGKKAEISLIKDLYTTCRNLRHEILEQREWVWLTDEDRDSFFTGKWTQSDNELIDAVEKRVRELNL